MFSKAFEYASRTGGRSTLVVPNVKSPYLRKGDNIGIALDLSVPIMTFFFNGIKVRKNDLCGHERCL